MKVLINEKERVVDKASVYELRDEFKKNADIVILNGFPIKDDINVQEGDRICFIKKGEMPKKEELEALMASRHTPKVHETLKRGKVAIAGAGGLGSNVAISLARIGVGHIKVIDFDVVEPSNLNRQQYYIKHIGMKKVYALKEILTEINPFIEVEVLDLKVEKDNIKDIFNGFDIVVEAFDNAVYKALLVGEILKNFKKTKIISASGMAGFYSNNIIYTKKINDRLYICGDRIHEAGINEGLMAPRVGIVANHEANTVLRLLLNEIEV
ncbi:MULTISPECIES: sulfur carrier protein ThiS adenylyltransferase ThiF [Clostridium]|uniref:Sulfur carrier protein ThiS adenylyltransferase ThiF n=1 Tax=Clostridium cibarium TaxID=2762247 RepID=A0ABR8PTE1_9CLOT|nr:MULTISPECIES: sulfur carrier protein ThiS adenylyltransferase ThiF [Clostridium]MBD7911380.1 sulfur carrier protein ThiS adenylyltransferase ThiF [Clostridium cibarium]